MVRGALWLKQFVGEGNIFTKHQVREAFPDTSQADRRIRDLRKFGWVINTNQQDASLTPEDLRLVRIGAAVWDKRARAEASKGSKRKTLSAKARQETFARDDYMCRTCGIAGGETYPDDPVHSAVLSIANREVVRPDGDANEMPVTQCKRCNSGSNGKAARLDRVEAAVDRLEPTQQAEFKQWVHQGKRSWTDLERAWSAFCGLPPEARALIESRIKDE